MSMHELEDLVETSIRTLSASKRPSSELRSIFWNVYEFQGAWDTAFTNLRVIDLLVLHRYAYRFALSEHPDYFPARAYFEKLAGSGLLSLPNQGEWDGGYYRGRELYFDAGSSLWERFVALGRLGGADADRPLKIDIYEIARDVAHLGREVGDRELIACWYRALAGHAVSEDDEESVRRSPVVLELRALVKETRALDIKTRRGFLNDPEPEQLREMPLLAWWYQLD